ncbi:hypothetical protein PR048_000882 [Dryococelus australis]|uniref:Uncharacterized protein n=1 Tax=Dryococelus australis TaxID=614101 RepID=A0ABQ9IFY5_9NEOP|nr:hypothetical protein PR048_000882 [Dryococelus australis]
MDSGDRDCFQERLGIPALRLPVRASTTTMTGLSRTSRPCMVIGVVEKAGSSSRNIHEYATSPCLYKHAPVERPLNVTASCVCFGRRVVQYCRVYVGINVDLVACPETETNRKCSEPKSKESYVKLYNFITELATWNDSNFVELEKYLRKYGATAECKGGETGDHREYPPTSGIVRHDSHVRKSGGDPVVNRTLGGRRVF